MYWFLKDEKEQKEWEQNKKYYTIRGHRFTIWRDKRATRFAVQFHYLVFKALDDDELARECVEAIMQSEGLTVLLDADNRQVYPKVIE